MALLSLMIEDGFEEEGEALGDLDWHVNWVCKALKQESIRRGS